MRIAIAGIHNEASTFSMHRADTDFFELTRGAELVEHYDLANRIGAATIADVEWVPLLRATSGASGPVLASANDAFESEILDGLRAAGALDGIYLDMHGAVAVEGRDNAEELFLARVREVVGPDVVISASMDTHGNLSRELADSLDLVAVHRHAPHIDLLETRDRAIVNLIDVLHRGQKPAKAHVRVPVLYPGERTSTVVEPGASVFGNLVPAIERHGVLDAGLAIGFAWADEARCAAGVVVTGWDAEAVGACALEIAQSYWDKRAEFVIVTDHFGPWSEAVDFVLAGAPAPVWVSDAGDNVTAGGSGDLTYALTESLADPALLASGRTLLFTGITDGVSLDLAITAGVGATRAFSIGAATDARYAPPVEGEWTVEALIEGAPGEGRVGALLNRGTVSVIVQAERTAFVWPDDPGFPPGVIKDLAFVDPSGYDVVVVKNGYLFPSQVAAAASSFMAITPGGTDLDVHRLAFERVERPLYPLDLDFDADLSVSLLHS
jgi:microcystin degradation protein MlrC